MSGLVCPDNYQRSANFLTRRSFVRGAAAATVCFSPSIAKASNSLGIDYLEGLSENSSLADINKFVAPHAVHDAYSHVMYVNVAYSGAAMQKMWVLRRRFSGWDLAYRDPTAVSGSDGWSWPVSSGALYANEARAGPTPVGVFNIDERTHRYIRRCTSTYTIHLAELRAWQSMEQHRVGTLTWGHQPAMGVFG